jgi:hypothetical protein
MHHFLSTQGSKLCLHRAVHLRWSMLELACASQGMVLRLSTPKGLVHVCANLPQTLHRLARLHISAVPVLFFTRQPSHHHCYARCVLATVLLQIPRHKPGRRVHAAGNGLSYLQPNCRVVAHEGRAAVFRSLAADSLLVECNLLHLIPAFG